MLYSQFNMIEVDPICLVTNRQILPPADVAIIADEIIDIWHMVDHYQMAVPIARRVDNASVHEVVMLNRNDLGDEGLLSVVGPVLCEKLVEIIRIPTALDFGRAMPEMPEEILLDIGWPGYIPGTHGSRSGWHVDRAIDESSIEAPDWVTRMLCVRGYAQVHAVTPLLEVGTLVGPGDMAELYNAADNPIYRDIQTVGDEDLIVVTFQQPARREVVVE